MLNKYKAELVEVGVVSLEGILLLLSVLNRGPISAKKTPTRLICGAGGSPLAAGRAALREASTTVGGVDISQETYDRIAVLSPVEFVDPELMKYVCIVICQPISDQ